MSDCCAGCTFSICCWAVCKLADSTVFHKKHCLIWKSGLVLYRQLNRLHRAKAWSLKSSGDKYILNGSWDSVLNSLESNVNTFSHCTAHQHKLTQSHAVISVDVSFHIRVCQDFQPFGPHTRDMQAQLHRYGKNLNCVTCWFYVSVKHTHSMRAEFTEHWGEAKTDAETDSERKPQGNHDIGKATEETLHLFLQAI